MSASTSLQASTVQSSATGITTQASIAQPEEQHHQQVAVVVPSYSMTTVAVVWFTGAFVGGAMGAIGFLAYWYVLGPEPVVPTTITTTTTTKTTTKTTATTTTMSSTTTTEATTTTPTPTSTTQRPAPPPPLPPTRPPPPPPTRPPPPPTTTRPPPPPTTTRRPPPPTTTRPPPPPTTTRPPPPPTTTPPPPPPTPPPPPLQRPRPPFVVRPICYSDSCMKLADLYKKVLNPLVDPCQNFGAHVCGLFRGPMNSIYERERGYLASGVAGLIRSVYRTSSGARGKAMFLFESCRAVHSQIWSSRQDLRDFMQRLKLSVSKPPSGAPTSPDAVLALHVELAYAYGLSALLKMRPRDSSSLALHFNGVLMHAALRRDDDPDFIISLARVVGVMADAALVQTRTELYTKMKIAVVNGHQKQASLATSRGVKQAKDLSFAGVSRNAFGDAVESKTPYSRTSSVFETPILKAMLESVWKDMSGQAQLFSWTSWHVADELVHFVDPAYTTTASPHSRFTQGRQFIAECMRMVSQVMAVPLISIAAVSQPDATVVTAITSIAHAVAGCLSGKKQWLSTFSATPNVVVGSPEFAKHHTMMDTFFSSFPTPNTSGRAFFVQWAAAAEAWRKHALPKALYFDPLETATDVAVDGSIIVPAMLARPPFFEQGRLVAANVGAIGHLIAMTLAERYLLPNVTVPAACQSPPGTRGADDSITSLLAYECSLKALVAMSGNKDEQLPRLGEVSPERMLFISACFKDCVYYRTMSTSCPSPPVRLKSFREAFWCTELQPPCVLT